MKAWEMDNRGTPPSKAEREKFAAEHKEMAEGFAWAKVLDDEFGGLLGGLGPKGWGSGSPWDPNEIEKKKKEAQAKDRTAGWNKDAKSAERMKEAMQNKKTVKEEL